MRRTRQVNGQIRTAALRARGARRSERRADIVEAAMRAIRRCGPKLTMDDVAAEAGISKPIVYRLFDDKTDLYVEVGRRVASSLVTEVTGELELPHGPRELVAAVVDTYLRAIEADPEVHRFIVQKSFADRPVARDPVSDYSSLVAAHLARLIGERLRAANLDSGGAEPWAHSIVGMVQAAGAWWLDRRSMSRSDLSEYLTSMLWGGIAGLYAEAGAGTDGLTPLRVMRGKGAPGS